MKHRAKKLKKPEEVIKDNVPIICTHQAHGFTYSEWADPPISSYMIKGIVVDDKFIPVSPPEYVKFSRTDYEELLQSVGLTEKGDFSVNEVATFHPIVLKRRQEEEG